MQMCRTKQSILDYDWSACDKPNMRASTCIAYKLDACANACCHRSPVDRRKHCQSMYKMCMQRSRSKADDSFLSPLSNAFELEKLQNALQMHETEEC